MLLAGGCVVPLELLGPPTPVDGGMDAGEQLSPAVSLNVGSSEACVTTAAGALYCFGENAFGQLGVGDTQQHPGPTFVDGGALRWVSSAIGERHTCALATTGDAYCWGENFEGALGTGEVGPHLTPTRVVTGNLRGLSAGDGYTCAVTAGGAILCWGTNSEGQLGQDPSFPAGASSVPVRVGAGSYRQVAAGQGHACGLSVDGGLDCWGRNTEGQAGSGSALTNIVGPAPALNGPWRSVSATQGSTCAIRTDGTLWCWGEGPSLNSRTPVQIGAATDWTQISVNEFHHCGRRGTDLYCWGRGIEGQLGLGDNDPQPSPTKLAGSWSTVATSRFHTCGLQTDGRLYCWGKNDRDELGQSDNLRRNSPTLVPLP
jgi:alpha-tubulin suppressor-like RCC1 family protein